MGKASRRKQNAIPEEVLRNAVARVSSALRKLVEAAGTHQGSDCFVHAELGRVLLLDLGISTRTVVGFAAWRVGSGDGDVVSHTSKAQGYLPTGTHGFAYHAWLRHEDWVIDFTTYQLRLKAEQLDLADGKHTHVEWCPDYLLLPQKALKSYKAVTQAPTHGVVYYESRPQLHQQLAAGFQLDAEDVKAARLILANPQVNVVGPNSFSSC